LIIILKVIRFSKLNKALTSKQDKLKMEKHNAVGMTNKFAADGVIAEQIESFQAQGDLYTKKIEIEKRRIRDLDDHLQKSWGRLTDARKSMGGLREAERQMKRKEKTMHQLENQLEKSIVRLNEAKALNMKLKSRIEDYRREKLQRLEIKRDLEKTLNEKKAEMVEIIQQSQKSFEARDNARVKIVELKRKIAKEVENFEKEWMDKMRQLEVDKKKYKENINNPEEKSGHQGQLTAKQEQSLRERSAKANIEIVKREVDLENQSEKIMTYKEAFSKIKKETGIETISQMVDEFVKSEDSNFSLFNQINELNREIEQLEVENQRYKVNIEKFKNQGASSEVAKNQIFSGLKRKIENGKKRLYSLEQQNVKSQKIMEDIKPGLLELFTVAGCAYASGPIGQQLVAQGPTESNIMQFLGVIEQRVQELVQLHKIKHGIPLKMGIESDSKPPTPRSKRRFRPRFAPRLPGAEDISSDEEDVEIMKPLRTSEMRRRLSSDHM
jgi:coiled-coil domain-containing protein 63/114